MEQHVDLLERGRRALAEGRWAEADQALRGALGAAPDASARAEALEALVALALDTGADVAAAAWLAEAERLHAEAGGPTCAGLGRTWALRARLYTLAEGDPRRAAEAWERAVRLLDGAPRRDALRGLGLARMDQGEHEAAERALEAALDGAEGWPRAEVLEALARLRGAQGQHERALALVHERVGLVHALRGPWTPEAADTLLLLAGTCEAAQDLESAASALDRAVEVLARLHGADDPETAMAAAYLLALRSRLAGAPAP